jgi:hypothetical protein
LKGENLRITETDKGRTSRRHTQPAASHVVSGVLEYSNLTLATLMQTAEILFNPLAPKFFLKF